MTDEKIQITIAIWSSLSAIASSIITIFLSEFIRNYSSKRKKQNELLFDIYMKLMEFEGYYFWLFSSETRKEKEPDEIKSKVLDLKWIILDMCRGLATKEVDDILKVLLLEKLTHRERYSELGKLINTLGYKANSRYKIAMSAIQYENEKMWQEEANNSDLFKSSL